jgi:peptidyl-prolyl cis-trans isomerase C
MARRVFVVALLVAFSSVSAFAQQQKAAAPAAGDDPVVARINGQVLHRSDLQLALRAAPAQVQQTPIEKIYPQLLGSMANGLLLAQAGRKAKIDAVPAVKAQIGLADNEIIADAYVAQLARAQITEAKLHEAYDQYAKNAPKEDEVNARHILVPTEQEAKDIIEQLKKGADFATLAKDKTTDPSGKTSGGDLGYFSKGEMVPDFANAAFALKKGEFTQTPVHTQFGWHVIKVEDRRTKPVPEFEQVKNQIETFVARRAQSEFVAQLRETAKIERLDRPAGAMPPMTLPSATPPSGMPPSQKK